jgi:hypothetical protein
VTINPLGCPPWSAEHESNQTRTHDSYTTPRDATLSQKIFDIPVAQVESIVERDSVGNDTRRESVAFIGVHRPILSILGS